MTNIFDEANERTMPEWASFKAAGDAVQGTYIGKITGQADSYGNEQIIYQLLRDDKKIVNVGFGLNKKILHQDMSQVNFGQIVGFKYKGTVEVRDKRTGKTVSVKEYALYHDPKIVNEKWLSENKGNMPTVTVTKSEVSSPASATKRDSELEDLVEELNSENDESDDVPFSSDSSLTNEDKLAVISKLAKDKLGATSASEVKDKVMGATGIAFIPVRYQEIIDSLSKM